VQNVECLLYSLWSSLLLRGVTPGLHKPSSHQFIRLRLYQLLLSRMVPLAQGIGTWLADFCHEIGAGVDLDVVSTTLQGVPGLLRLSEDANLTDDVILLSLDMQAEALMLEATTVEGRVFIGNSTVIGAGCHLHQGSFVGMLSHLPRGTQAESGSSWFGNPAVRLVRDTQSSRERRIDGSQEGGTELSVFESWAIGTLELCCTVLPFCFLMLEGVCTSCVLHSIEGAGATLDSFLLVCVVPILHVAVNLLQLFLVWAAKWRLVGRIQAGDHHCQSLFSLTKKLSDMFGSELAASCVILDLLGTPFVVWWFRALGAHIGENCWLNTPFLSEPDLAVIGADVCLGEGAEVQSHLFENELLRLGTVTIEDGATLHCEAIAVMKSTIKSQAELYPLSVPLPEEEVSGPHQEEVSGPQMVGHSGSWIGNPLQPCERFAPPNIALGCTNDENSQKLKLT